jgi:di/tricarboxylate transporter
MDPIHFIWAIPIFFSLHELEEWNILNWYKKYYVNLPGSTNFSIHLHIVFFCIVGFLLTYIAYQFRQTFLFSLVISFLSGFILLNTFQHIVWTFQLKTYSPGLASSIIILFVIVIVNIILIRNNMIQVPFYALILLFILPAINTLKIKNEMTPEIRRVHIFFINIENLFRYKNRK